jgi:hypothetical protein
VDGGGVLADRRAGLSALSSLGTTGDAIPAVGGPWRDPEGTSRGPDARRSTSAAGCASPSARGYAPRSTTQKRFPSGSARIT